MEKRFTKKRKHENRNLGSERKSHIFLKIYYAKQIAIPIPSYQLKGDDIVGMWISIVVDFSCRHRHFPVEEEGVGVHVFEELKEC